MTLNPLPHVDVYIVFVREKKQGKTNQIQKNMAAIELTVYSCQMIGLEATDVFPCLNL